jgi:hypothetical protein
MRAKRSLKGHDEYRASATLSTYNNQQQRDLRLPHAASGSSSKDAEDTDLSKIENPFSVVSRERHPRSRSEPIKLPHTFKVDGYVKVEVSPSKGVFSLRPIHHERHSTGRYVIPGLPANFGRNIRWNRTDQLLMKFCKSPTKWFSRKAKSRQIQSL